MWLLIEVELRSHLWFCYQSHGKKYHFGGKRGTIQRCPTILPHLIINIVNKLRTISRNLEVFLDEENMLRYRLKGESIRHGKKLPPPPPPPPPQITSSHDDAQLSAHAVIVLGAFVVSSLFFDIFCFLCNPFFLCCFVVVL